MRLYSVFGLALSLAIPASTSVLPRDATPEPAAVPPSKLFCDVVNGLVTGAKQQPQATSFCSSYLRIPVVTKTSTSTLYTATVVQTVTFTSGTTTLTDTTASTTITEIETVSTVSYTTITACATPGAAAKRAVAVKPKCLATYVEGTALSSACKCLSVPTSSSTSTAILSVPTTSTVSITVPLTIHATPITTHIITNTVTQYTATSPILANPTFAIYAIYSDNSGNTIGGLSDSDLLTLSPSAPLKLQFTLEPLTNQVRVLNGPFPGSTLTQDSNLGDTYVFMGHETETGHVPITCRVVPGGTGPGTCPLDCRGFYGLVSYACPSAWRMWDQLAVSGLGGCRAFTPYVVGGLGT